MLKVHRNQVSQTPPRQLSLLVAFYQQLDVLRLLLASLEQQSFKNFELIICDDGSAPEVVASLQAEIAKYSFPILHLWHPDKGWRKNRILNWGIYFARASWLVFVDQDCILHPEFLLEHYSQQDIKVVLCGRRMDLVPWVSRQLTIKSVAAGFLQKNLWWLILVGLGMKDNNGPKAIYLRSPWLRRLVNKKPRGIVGCNFSVAKTKLLEINGFDTRYEGPGTGEDSDIEFRLGLKGVLMRPFVNTAVQYHVYHPLKLRPNSNEQLFAEVKRAQVASTAFGLQQQLEEEGSHFDKE